MNTQYLSTYIDVYSVSTYIRLFGNNIVLKMHVCVKFDDTRILIFNLFQKQIRIHWYAKRKHGLKGEHSVLYMHIE